MHEFVPFKALLVTFPWLVVHSVVGIMLTACHSGLSGPILLKENLLFCLGFKMLTLIKVIFVVCHLQVAFSLDTKAAVKVEDTLTTKALLKDIGKMSPLHQTSSLEAFHSLILRFAPKNTSFSYIGMKCRSVNFSLFLPCYTKL